MLIVKKALVKAEEFDSVVLHSKDTDIFIALLHHLEVIFIRILSWKQRCVSISEIAEQLSSKIRECQPFAHAVSRCDTVSATYGLGKLRAYKKLHESDSWRDIMCIVGDEDVDRVYMIELGEKFNMELYGKLGKKADSLDHLREIMYTIPRYIPISRMSPTSRAFRFHMLRARLEGNTCKNLEQRLEEEDHGFQRNADGQLIPIITDKSRASTYLLQDMKCSCVKPNRTGLLCTGCSCCKAGLSCTLLCKCDGNCENYGVGS